MVIYRMPRIFLSVINFFLQFFFFEKIERNFKKLTDGIVEREFSDGFFMGIQVYLRVLIIRVI